VSPKVLPGVGLASAVAFVLVVGSACAVRQPGRDTVESHVAAAKAAAGGEHLAVLDLCEAPEPDPTPPDSTPGAKPPGPPSRSEWHVEPVKVFDNLYFVGQKDYSAWAVTTSAGIIVLDTLWDVALV